MDKEIHLKITDQDIANAVRKDPAQCFMAKAMEKAGLQNVCATHSEISWSTDNGRYWAVTPWSVKKRMISFDYGHRIKPFEIALRPQSGDWE